jgi:undecaprenyl-diphosphatase
LLEAVFLGLLQGLTEFLPISSSAHIRVAGLFNPQSADPGATFTAIIQIGTELAVILYFRREIWRILINWSRSISRKPHDSAEAKLGWFIIFGSLPIIFFGYFFQETIRDEFRDLWLIAMVLILGGIFIGLADRYGKHHQALASMRRSDSWIAGFAQSLALIPGVSRSGATIGALRILGFKRVDALKFSFLLAIPAVMASGIFELANSLSNPELSRFSGVETLVATLIAFLVGYAVVAWLLRFVSKYSFMPFVIYRLILGSILLILLSLGVISN